MLNVVKHLKTSTCANRFLTSFEMTGEGVDISHFVRKIHPFT